MNDISNMIYGGFVQIGSVWANPERNLEVIKDKLTSIREEAPKGVPVLAVLPELCLPGGYAYSSRDALLEHAETVDGQSIGRLMKIAKNLEMCVVAGFAELVKADDPKKVKLYNSAIAVTPEGIAEATPVVKIEGQPETVPAVYRKLHLYNTENVIFDIGDKGFLTFDYGGAKIGMMICYDYSSTRAVDTLASTGADIIVHPCNLDRHHAREFLTTDALRNRVYIITADRIGDEPGMHFIGAGQLTPPNRRRPLYVAEGEVKSKFELLDLSLARDKRPDPMKNQYNNVMRDKAKVARFFANDYVVAANGGNGDNKVEE
ncbi:nitrilase-related carbon-nitrogen hydrolase [Nanoarchaeota archaeon]